MFRRRIKCLVGFFEENDDKPSFPVFSVKFAAVPRIDECILLSGEITTGKSGKPYKPCGKVFSVLWKDNEIIILCKSIQPEEGEGK